MHLRPIRSFVRRQGRITDRQKKALSDLWPKYGLNINYEHPYVWEKVFSQNQNIADSKPIKKLISENNESEKNDKEICSIQEINVISRNKEITKLSSEKECTKTLNKKENAKQISNNSKDIDQYKLGNQNEECHNNTQKKLILEIGFGMGNSLLSTAINHPKEYFIGVEVYTAGIGSLIADLEEKGINNIRIFNSDIKEVLNSASIANESLDRVHIFFPDPWHKKKHHKRRLIQEDFIQLLLPKIAINGHLHIVTDWEEYALHISNILSKFSHLLKPRTEHQGSEYRPLTKYEARGCKLGHKISEFIHQKLED